MLDKNTCLSKLLCWKVVGACHPKDASYTKRTSKCFRTYLRFGKATRETRDKKTIFDLFVENPVKIVETGIEKDTFPYKEAPLKVSVSKLFAEKPQRNRKNNSLKQGRSRCSKFLCSKVTNYLEQRQTGNFHLCFRAADQMMPASTRLNCVVPKGSYMELSLLSNDQQTVTFDLGSYFNKVLLQQFGADSKIFVRGGIFFSRTAAQLDPTTY